MDLAIEPYGHGCKTGLSIIYTLQNQAKEEKELK
jgi:hypothetical protein